MDDLTFLKESVPAIKSLKSLVEVYDYTTERILSLLDGKAIVTIADINQQNNEWLIQSVTGLGGKTKKLQKLLGFDIKKFKGKVNPKYDILLSSPSFAELELDFPEMLNGKVSQKIGDTIVNLLSIQKIYCMGMLQSGKSYANVSIITKKGCKEINFALLDAFIELVSISVDKIKTEKHLVESEERLALALKSAQQGTYDLNVQTGNAIVSDEYATMLGYDPDNFVETNEKWINRLHPDDKEKVARAYKDYIDGKFEDYRVEFRQKMKNGKWKWILSQGKIMEFDSRGEPLRMLGTHTDLNKIKQTELELRQSREQLRALFDNMSGGFAYHEIITDKSGKAVDYVFLDVNRAFERLTGLKASNIIGKKVTEVLPSAGNDPANWISRYGEVAISGKAINFEQYSEDLGRWFQIDAYSPEENFFATVFVDITDRKMAEKALQQSEEQYRHLFDNLQIGIYRTRISDGKLILANKRMAELFGYENPQKAMDEFITAEHYVYNGARKKMLNLLHDQGRFDKYEAALTNAKGEVRWYQYSGVMFEEEDYIEGVATDITDRVRAERELRINTDIINSTTDGIVTTDLQGNVLGWNNGAEMIYGYKAEEMIGRSIDVIYQEKDLPLLNRLIKQLISGEKIHNTELELINKKGEKLPVLLSLTSLKNMAGEIIQLAGFSRDITQLKNVENELKKRNEFVQTVLDNMPIGVALNKMDEGTATYINDKFQEIYGWPKEELKNISRFFEKVFPEKNYRKKIMKRVIGDIESGVPERMHWEGLIPTAKDGTKRVINTVNIPLFGQNTMVSTVIDVTDQKNAENELSRHKEKLEEMVRERTGELEQAINDLNIKNKELAHFNELFVNREFRINELKERIKELEAQMKTERGSS